MRIIKHKTRRRRARSFEDNGYLVVEGEVSVGTIEEAVDLAMDAWREELAGAKPAPTLWDMYGGARCAGARR